MAESENVPRPELNRFEKSRIVVLLATQPLAEEGGKSKTPKERLADVRERVLQYAMRNGLDWQIKDASIKTSLERFYVNLTGNQDRSFTTRTRRIFDEVIAQNPAIRTHEDLRSLFDSFGVFNKREYRPVPPMPPRVQPAIPPAPVTDVYEHSTLDQPNPDSATIEFDFDAFIENWRKVEEDIDARDISHDRSSYSERSVNFDAPLPNWGNPTSIKRSR